ncbi:hypothetical protein Q7P35_000432 [Cladosporium inversicolor]
MSSSYRPQSPDLSTANVYRPQSPDLSSLGPATTSQPPHHPNQPGHIPTAYDTESAYRGPTSSFAPDSIPALPVVPQQSYPQQYYGNPPPHHNMPPSGIKEEDDDYMPDAYTRSSRNASLVQNAYMPNNGPSMGYPQAQIKEEAPQDPTHGVALKTSFPVARIKRIMQADEDIGKVAQVTPHVVSRALELFMIKLITASADHARGGPASGASKGPKRVLAQHLKRAIQADETFDFLADIIAKVPDAPASKAKKEQAGSDSEETKPKPRKGRKRKDSGDDL